MPSIANPRCKPIKTGADSIAHSIPSPASPVNNLWISSSRNSHRYDRRASAVAVCQNEIFPGISSTDPEAAYSSCAGAQVRSAQFYIFSYMLCRKLSPLKLTRQPRLSFPVNYCRQESPLPAVQLHHSMCSRLQWLPLLKFMLLF